MLLAVRTEFVRDGRAPIPRDPKISKTMSRIRAKNSKPELALRKALSLAGVRGYRLHPKNIPGKPDVCFIGKRVAVFVNGCFWHQCPFCTPKGPKSHKRFWMDKFTKNVARDKKNIATLKAAGWMVIVCWECKIKKDIQVIVKRIEKGVS